MLPQQRVPKRIVREGVPVPQLIVKTVETIRSVLSGRKQERIAEQISLLVPKTTEKIVESIQPVPSESVHERVAQQISLSGGLDHGENRSWCSACVFGAVVLQLDFHVPRHGEVGETI